MHFSALHRPRGECEWALRTVILKTGIKSIFSSHSAQKSLWYSQPQSAGEANQGFRIGPGIDVTGENTQDC